MTMTWTLSYTLIPQIEKLPRPIADHEFIRVSPEDLHSRVVHFFMSFGSFPYEFSLTLSKQIGRSSIVHDQQPCRSC